MNKRENKLILVYKLNGHASIIYPNAILRKLYLLTLSLSVDSVQALLLIDYVPHIQWFRNYISL